MATNWVEGTISRVYSDDDRSLIMLSGIPASDTPKDGYFELKSTHANYKALYALILAAAINRYKILIRARSNITNSSHAEVQYVVVDW